MLLREPHFTRLTITCMALCIRKSELVGTQFKIKRNKNTYPVRVLHCDQLSSVAKLEVYL